MKKQPVVSIIVPIYNVEKYLRRCLDSILAQTFDNWEAVCVNDGSPDGCDKILNQYAARDKRFRVFSQKNSGQSVARNFGMQRARGEYILFVDSDDFIHPQTLEITVKLAHKYNVDMVSFTCDWHFHHMAYHKMQKFGNITGLLPKSRNVKYNVKKLSCWVTDNVLFHCTERNHSLCVRYPRHKHCFPVLCLYRRDLIKDLKFISGIIMEDFPWWCSVILRRPRTAMINIPLYFYMPNPTSSLNSSHALHMINSISTGVAAAYMVYHANATIDEFNYFNREFLWPFVITSMRKLTALSNGFERDNIRVHMRKLWNAGIFDMPPHWRARKYRRRIWEFINE